MSTELGLEEFTEKSAHYQNRRDVFKSDASTKAFKKYWTHLYPLLNGIMEPYHKLIDFSNIFLPVVNRVNTTVYSPTDILGVAIITEKPFLCPDLITFIVENIRGVRS